MRLDVLLPGLNMRSLFQLTSFNFELFAIAGLLRAALQSAFKQKALSFRCVVALDVAAVIAYRIAPAAAFRAPLSFAGAVLRRRAPRCCASRRWGSG
eukprot:151121-Pyramimonas_sp.AAC.1